ncbi:hypothetical protein Mgra_00006185 [Meloidogyne graminicola]|uniref:Uncharacterized protein n=1 Tax=Meloidogyne graminicola TaxID=189291 RepID=A0A8S9ZM32_9BILA|nr:hypothetical protein Mgra_00006185 [Meloidogyne graminicola]
MFSDCEGNCKWTSTTNCWTKPSTLKKKTKMGEENKSIKREREDEDEEILEDRDDFPVVIRESSNAVLQNKLEMLIQEESALLSILSRLRSHQRTLQLEQNKLTELYENKMKERE